MCVCANLHVCVHAFVSCVCVVCVHLYVCAYICMCKCACVYVCVHVCVCKCYIPETRSTPVKANIEPVSSVQIKAQDH